MKPNTSDTDTAFEPSSTYEGKKHTIQSTGGWKLNMMEYTRSNDSKTRAVQTRQQSANQRQAVLFLHGLASNRHTFMIPGADVVGHFVKLGYTVLTPELRSHGLSKDDSGKLHGYFGVDDYIDDARAILRYWFELTGEGVHWIGHSMGGIIGLSLLMHPEAEHIKTLTTVASSLFYKGSAWARITPLLRVVGMLPSFPSGSLMRFLAPIGFRLPAAIDLFMAVSANIDGNVGRHLYRVNFEPIVKNVLKQLGTAFTCKEGFLSHAKPVSSFLGKAKELSIPVTLIGADWDIQCPTPCVLKLARAMEAAGVQPAVKLFGKRYGHAEDYGHFDLLIGKNFEKEVLPSLLEAVQARGLH